MESLNCHDAEQLDDACIFLQREKSHLAVGGWVYIETPERLEVIGL